MTRALVRVLLFAVLAAGTVQAGENLGSPSASRTAGWRLTSPALFDVTVGTIALDPRSPSTIYAGGYTGTTLRQSVALFRSDDGGLTWRRIQNSVSGLFVVSLWVNLVNPDVMYAGAFGGGVYKSVDRGENWTRLAVGNVPWVNSFVMDQRSPETLYVALGGDGIYKTTDGGGTWTLISEGLGVTGVVAHVSIDPVSSSRLYVTGAGKLYRSDDSGATWQVVREGVEGLLWIDPTDPATLYVLGEGEGLLKSVDRGITWAPIGAGLPSNLSLGPLLGDPVNPAVLYVGTGGAGVFRSADGGVTWTAFNNGIEDRTVRSLLIPPSGEPALYAGTDAGLFDHRTRLEFQVTLPAVASLHGVPPTFFHSDVWVFNSSAESEATVTATYRCLTGSPCAAAPQTFTIPPRQVKTFRDIAVSLFNFPESGGAIEFESDRVIVIGSRLYTPAASEPTTGMFVPGLRPEHAGASQVLTSLSHSADAAAGFRTNVGFYNGTDTGTFVKLAFFEESGTGLGEILLFSGPRQPLQLNDAEIFQRLRISRDVPNFYCVVGAYLSETPIHSYASVIDNRSQDPIFVTGEDAAAISESKITLPAVAAIHGAGGAFFHSDVRVWNASRTSFAEVTARFACFDGNCGERVFTVAPRQVLVFDDVITTLFHSTEEGGALEFVSQQPLVVTSRLYTPAASEPTVGMFVPGLPPGRASPAVVLNGLSRPSDSSSGSRVNVGVFNQADVAQVVTYRLFDATGSQLGQTMRLFAPREVFQINDIFALLNVTGSVENAYCLIEGSERLPIFSYAAVIDNRSQDPIFIPGEADPERPMIRPSAGSR